MKWNLTKNKTPRTGKFAFMVAFIDSNFHYWFGNYDPNQETGKPLFESEMWVYLPKFTCYHEEVK